MNKKIIFIDMNPANEQIPIYQLGICFLGGIAIEKGWSVDIIQYYNLQEHGLKYYADKLDEAKCIAISIRNIDNTEGCNPISYLDMVNSYISELSTLYSEKIILGGAGFSILPYEILKMFDLKYGIVGRGGEILSKMLDWLDSGDNFATFFSQKIVRSGVDCNVYQYEKLEYIWNVIPYIEDKRKILGFDTHVGCNGHCIYCTYPGITQNQGSRRSLDEICKFISVAEKNGFEHLQIVDDIFNSDLEYAKYICNGIAKISHNIKISCYLSPNIDKELVQFLRKAGIVDVVMGIDSLSNIVLKHLNKGFTEEQIYMARQMLGEEGISVAYTFIVGSIFETVDTLEETKANILKHMPDKVSIQYGIRIYPGTPLFSELEVDKDYIWQPQFAVSKTVPKEKIINFIMETTGLIDERKML